MPSYYHPLSHHQLSQRVLIQTPPEHHGSAITQETPAIRGMTDLSQIRPLMIDPFATITQANERMISFAVRMLFVAQSSQQMIGIITAADILGEKPVQYMNQVNCLYDEIQVRDIMTPIAELKVLRLDEVERGRIGDIIATLKSSGHQHALVVETDVENKQEYVCGIFSTSHISRLMNVRVEIDEVATNFAAIQNALS